MARHLPEVRLFSLEEGAAAAVGTVVVIDVFRAFTTAAVALERGAMRVLMVADIDTALSLRSAGAVDVCVGERHAAKPSGFDFGNSPAALARADLTGRRIALTTSNGTRGLIAARGATRLFAGALVNAGATVAAIQAERPRVVSLVAMGSRAGRAAEDELCALYLRSRLLGLHPDSASVAAAIRALVAPIPEALQRSGDYPPEDRAIALDIDSVPIAAPVGSKGEHLAVGRR
ncbi:MAG: 2-phosphosulfolactate phosphatase [Proteobacteria bacterium]|nr:2-phosphosulfolactate phosphatase [Pseudomonadota bacterium]MBI3497715.1 2-phosphosulfolactate phosphatase [Pseudomonadota bacterium]